MRLFQIFKRKQFELTEEQKKWNKMWDLWVEGQVGSPYAELMTYQSEINNGGHGQYFTNIENTGDLPKEIAALETILSEKLIDNLQKAYKEYLVLEEKENDDSAEDLIWQYDSIFYNNEGEVNCILQEYANKIEL